MLKALNYELAIAMGCICGLGMFTLIVGCFLDGFFRHRIERMEKLDYGHTNRTDDDRKGPRYALVLPFNAYEKGEFKAP